MTRAAAWTRASASRGHPTATSKSGVSARLKSRDRQAVAGIGDAAAPPRSSHVLPPRPAPPPLASSSQHRYQRGADSHRHGHQPHHRHPLLHRLRAVAAQVRVGPSVAPPPLPSPRGCRPPPQLPQHPSIALFPSSLHSSLSRRFRIYFQRLVSPLLQDAQRPPPLLLKGHYRLWSWVIPVFKVSDQTLLETAGLDALVRLPCRCRCCPAWCTQLPLGAVAAAEWLACS